jgi:hypothetical protein
MNRKGQSATEFITTYGFALVIIAIGVGGVFYFLDTGRTIPNQCHFTDPFVCNDIKVEEGETAYGGENQVTIDLTASGIELDGTAEVNMVINGISTDCGTISALRSTLTCPGKFGEDGSIFSGTVSITYKLDGGSIDHVSVYTITGTIEQSGIN